AQLKSNFGVAKDESDFTPLVEFGAAKALATDKNVRSIADNGAGVETQFGQLPSRQFASSDDSNVDTFLDSFIEQADHLDVGDGGIIDQQFFFGGFDESGKFLARIDGTDDETGCLGRIFLPLHVGFEQPFRFLNQLGLFGHDAETAAAVDVDVSEVERQHV